MIRKTPEEIVITFQGRKIFSTLLSPQRIGVDYDGEFGKPIDHAVSWRAVLTDSMLRERPLGRPRESSTATRG
jgi:hypothetical protein